MVLDNITLSNIHLYNMPIDNKVKLLGDVSCDGRSTIAEQIIKRLHSN